MMSIVFLDNENIFRKFNPLGQTVYQQLSSPMAIQERCQDTTSRHIAHSELTSASCLASPHGFVNHNEHDDALHPTPT